MDKLGVLHPKQGGRWVFERHNVVQWLAQQRLNLHQSVHRFARRRKVNIHVIHRPAREARCYQNRAYPVESVHDQAGALMVQLQVYFENSSYMFLLRRT